MAKINNQEEVINEVEVTEVPVIEEPVEKPAKKKKNLKGIVKCQILNVRKASETNAPIVEIVNVDTELDVVNDGKVVNGFVAVKTPAGNDGFVMNEFIEIK